MERRVSTWFQAFKNCKDSAITLPIDGVDVRIWSSHAVRGHFPRFAQTRRVCLMGGLKFVITNGLTNVTGSSREKKKGNAHAGYSEGK